MLQRPISKTISCRTPLSTGQILQGGPFIYSGFHFGYSFVIQIQTNLDPHGETKLVGFIESFGAPPQTRFRKGSEGGSPQRGLGGAPAGSETEPQWAPPLKLLSVELPGWGGGGFKRVHDSIKPQVWSRRFVAKFV